MIIPEPKNEEIIHLFCPIGTVSWDHLEEKPLCTTRWQNTWRKKWGNFIDIKEANLDVPVTPSFWLNIAAPMIPELPRQAIELREKKKF